jgi:diguanylate cyclase (GGDEF)-like protein
MKRQYPQFVDGIEEKKHAERVIFGLIWISWAAYLVAMISGLYFSDALVITATLISSVLLILPFWLVRQGHPDAGGQLIVLISLVNVTILATVGQGIHDVSIMAYPTLIIYASLALSKFGFRLCVVLTLLSMAWLVFGEAGGLFVSKAYKTPNFVDYLVITAILLTAASAVNILASNMRKNLEQAKLEIAQRRSAEEQLRHQSTHDSMTDIYNRNFFETELARLEHSREFPISVVIADIDGLKFVNDTLGHAVGDEKLRQTADVLRSVFRAGDILARIGGDEFAALLPATDAAAAEQIISRIHFRLAEHNTRYADLPLQLSLGAATAEKNDLARTFTLADQRMYADKSARKSNANLLPPA